MMTFWPETCVYNVACIDLLRSYPSQTEMEMTTYIPNYITDCSNMPNFDQHYIRPRGAACRIMCGESDPRYLFAFLGATMPMATGICIFLITLVVLASLYLLGTILQREARWILSTGSLTINTGLAYFVVLYSVSGSEIPTILNPQPVVAAMTVAVFCYFFSGFQYAVSPGYELAPAVLLLAAGYPLWFAVAAVSIHSDQPKSFPAFLGGMGFATAMVALVWTIHSALYRTIGYRAAWIRAWRLQQSSAEVSASQNAHMSRLWTLAAAQEQPTWRTGPGQSTGVVLLILVWAIVFNYDDTCGNYERIPFLKAMIYLPPVLLTVATVLNQVMISVFGFDSAVVESFINEYRRRRRTAATRNDIKGQIPTVIGTAMWSASWCCKLVVPSRADYIDAVTAYKLGRNMLYVDPNVNIYRGYQDTFFGSSIWVIDIGLHLTSVPILAVLAMSRMCCCCFGATGSNLLFRSTQFQNLKRALGRFLDARRDAMQRRACKILCKHCGEDSAAWTAAEETLQLPSELDVQVKEIFSKHPKEIRFTELLESTKAPELRYLLARLDEVLAADAATEQELEFSDPENSSNLNRPVLKRYSTFS